MNSWKLPMACTVLLACNPRASIGDRAVTITMTSTDSAYGVPIDLQPFVLIGAASGELDRGRGTCTSEETGATEGFAITATAGDDGYLVQSTELNLGAGVWTCTVTPEITPDATLIAENSQLTLEVTVFIPACELAANMPDDRPLAIGGSQDLAPRCRCSGTFGTSSVALRDDAFTLGNFTATGGAVWNDEDQLLDVNSDIPIELAGDCIYGVDGEHSLPVVKKATASWDLEIDCFWPAALDKTLDPLYVDTSANPEASHPIDWYLDWGADRTKFADFDWAARFDLFEVLAQTSPGTALVLEVQASNDEGFRDTCGSDTMVVGTATPGAAATVRGLDPYVISSVGLPTGPFTLRMVITPSRAAGRLFAVGDASEYLVLAVDANNRVTVDLGGVVPQTGGQLDTIPTLVTETWGPGLPVELKIVHTGTELVLYRDGAEVDRQTALDLPHIDAFAPQLMGVADTSWEALVIAPRADAGPRNVRVDLVSPDPTLRGGLRCSFESLPATVEAGQRYACEEGTLEVASGTMWRVE